MSRLFALRGELTAGTRILLEVGGLAFILLVWYLVTMGETPWVDGGILPKPGEVLASIPELFNKNELLKNVCRSLGFNIAGYVEALAIALPLGFLIGLFPFFRGTLQRPVDALRYIPLPAAIGLFIAWFGIGTELKVHFLAFGIMIYLVPVVVQRIDEVKDVYLKTVYTLGATNWQTIRTVYFPSVISRLSDDIRVLTAISWTYIIIAESIGGEGGIGKLIWQVGQRRGRMDIVFALLILIILIGIFQDKIFVNMDRKFFPYKFQDNKKEAKASIGKSILSYIGELLVWLYLVGYALLWLNNYTGMLTNMNVLDYLFGETVWVIHFIFILVLFYKGKQLYTKFTKNKSVAPVKAKSPDPKQ